MNEFVPWIDEGAEAGIGFGHHVMRPKLVRVVVRWVLAAIFAGIGWGTLIAGNGPESPSPIDSLPRDATTQMEMTRRQVFSALCGVAVQAYETETREWSMDELHALAGGYAVLKDENAGMVLREKALALDPENATNLMLYGATLNCLDRGAQAIDVCRRGLDSRYSRFASHEMAKGCLRAGRYDELYLLTPELLTTRYEQDDDGLWILLEFARCDPDLDRAREIFSRALAGVPDVYLTHSTSLAPLAIKNLVRLKMNERLTELLKVFAQFAQDAPELAGLWAQRSTAPWVRAQSRSALETDGAVIPEEGSGRKVRIVREIEVQSCNRYTTITPNAVVAAMHTKVGRAHAEKVIEADVRRLYATGVISNLRIFAEEVVGGIRVIVVIEEGVTQ